MLGVLAAVCPFAFALNPTLDINQYAHKAWTVREGFFRLDLRNSQMPDGYLWMGTDLASLDSMECKARMATAERRASAEWAHSQLAGGARGAALDRN